MNAGSTPLQKTTASHAMRKRRTRALIATASLAALALTGGCETISGWFGGGKNEQPQATPVQPDASAPPQYQAEPPIAATQPRTTVAPVPSALQPISRPVVTGRLPQDQYLMYLVETDGAIRVANVETGEEIATFDARASQIVRVTARGVTLGNQPVIGATLAPGTYGIYRVLPGDAGTVRATQGRSVPAVEMPASRPSNLPPPGFERLSPTPPPRPATQPGAGTSIPTPAMATDPAPTAPPGVPPSTPPPGRAPTPPPQ